MCIIQNLLFSQASEAARISAICVGSSLKLDVSSQSLARFRYVLTKSLVAIWSLYQWLTIIDNIYTNNLQTYDGSGASDERKDAKMVPLKHSKFSKMYKLLVNSKRV